MSAPLDVFADLRLAIDGEDIDIRGHGERLTIDLTSLRAGWKLLSSGPLAGDRGETTEQIHETLRRFDLTADVELQGERVAQLGDEARPGFVGRLLDVDGVELRPLSLLLATMRRHPLLAGGLILGLLFIVGWWLWRD